MCGEKKINRLNFDLPLRLDLIRVRQRGWRVGNNKLVQKTDLQIQEAKEGYMEVETAGPFSPTPMVQGNAKPIR
jgi:hypothetical protein